MSEQEPEELDISYYAANPLKKTADDDTNVDDMLFSFDPAKLNETKVFPKPVRNSAMLLSTKTQEEIPAVVQNDISHSEPPVEEMMVTFDDVPRIPTPETRTSPEEATNAYARAVALSKRNTLLEPETNDGGLDLTLANMDKVTKGLFENVDYSAFDNPIPENVASNSSLDAGKSDRLGRPKRPGKAPRTKGVMNVGSTLSLEENDSNSSVQNLKQDGAQDDPALVKLSSMGNLPAAVKSHAELMKEAAAIRNSQPLNEFLGALSWADLAAPGGPQMKTDQEAIRSNPNLVDAPLQESNSSFRRFQKTFERIQNEYGQVEHDKERGVATPKESWMPPGSQPLDKHSASIERNPRSSSPAQQTNAPESLERFTKSPTGERKGLRVPKQQPPSIVTASPTLQRRKTDIESPEDHSLDRSTTADRSPKSPLLAKRGNSPTNPSSPAESSRKLLANSTMDPPKVGLLEVPKPYANDTNSKWQARKSAFMASVRPQTAFDMASNITVSLIRKSVALADEFTGRVDATPSKSAFATDDAVELEEIDEEKEDEDHYEYYSASDDDVGNSDFEYYSAEEEDTTAHDDIDAGIEKLMNTVRKKSGGATAFLDEQDNKRVEVLVSDEDRKRGIRKSRRLQRTSLPSPKPAAQQKKPVDAMAPVLTRAEPRKKKSAIVRRGKKGLNKPADEPELEDELINAEQEGIPAPARTLQAYNEVKKVKKMPKALRDPKVRKQVEKMKVYKPFFTYTVIFINGLVMIYILVYSYITTGVVFSFSPLNIMLGPNPPVLVRLGAKFVPCMKLGYENLTYDCSVFQKHTTTLSTTQNFSSGALEIGLSPSNNVIVIKDTLPTSPALEGNVHLFKRAVPAITTLKASVVTTTAASIHTTASTHTTPSAVVASVTTPVRPVETPTGTAGGNGVIPCGIEEYCGLQPFQVATVPDQWYRLISAMFLHGGILHYASNSLFMFDIGVAMEEVYGPWRVGLVYFVSGIGGFMFGANVTAFSASVGASGAIYGILGSVLLDLLFNFKLVRKRWKELGKLTTMIVVYLCVGLLPLMDNFSHFGGFFIGVLMSMLLYTPITFNKTDKFIKVTLRMASLPILIGLFIWLIVSFQSKTNTCTWCRYLDCIPISDWCDAKLGPA